MNISVCVLFYLFFLHELFFFCFRVVFRHHAYICTVERLTHCFLQNKKSIEFIRSLVIFEMNKVVNDDSISFEKSNVFVLNSLMVPILNYDKYPWNTSFNMVQSVKNKMNIDQVMTNIEKCYDIKIDYKASTINKNSVTVMALLYFHLCFCCW